MTLNNCNVGERIIVKDMDSDPKVKKRLQDMGLTTGSMLRVMSNYSDNAFIVKIRGSKVVLGKDIAEKISVELVQGGYNGGHNGHGCGHKCHKQHNGRGFQRGYKNN